PSGGAGNGQISVTIPGVISTQGGNTGTFDLTAAQRSSGITFDRFGLVPNLIRTSSSGENVFIDDMTYTIADGVVTPFSEWNVDANGNWSVPGNWLGGVPNAVGAAAKFGSKILA